MTTINRDSRLRVAARRLVDLVLAASFVFVCAGLSQTRAQTLDDADEKKPIIKVDVLPAAVTSFGLPALKLNPLSTVKKVSDKAFKASVTNSVLHIQTGEDIGEDVTFSIVMHQPKGGDRTIQATMRTTLPLSIRADGDGKVPNLQVNGLGPQNAFAGALKISVEGGVALDPSLTRVSLRFPDNTNLDLSPYWKYNKHNKKITISLAAMSTVRSLIPRGTFEVRVNVVSADGDFVANYSFTGTKPQATIRGTLVDSNGAAVKLHNRVLSLVGSHTGVRRVAKLKLNGTFVFPGVVADTYTLELLDIKTPGLTKSSVVVYPLDTDVNATLVLSTAGSLSNGSPPPGRRSAVTTHRERGGWFTGDGPRPPQRQLDSRPSRQTPAAADTGPCIAVAAARDSTQTCTADLVVPQGSAHVSVKISVFTQEYPYYTGQQSQYDDTWFYTVSGIPGQYIQANNHVNATHVNTGEIKYQTCADVAAFTKGGALTVSAKGGATNIGDSLLATTVTIDLAVGCNDLSVTSATFGSTAKNGYTVLYKHDNYGGVISIPTSTLPQDWGVPLNVIYSPSDAVVTAATLNLIIDGVNVGQAALPLPAQHSNGVIDFRDMLMPLFPIEWTNSPVSFNIQLTGTVNGVAAISDGTLPNITKNDKLTFKPLFLAGDDPVLATHRYGSHTGGANRGGDSWAVNNTIDWLAGTSFNGQCLRFDDITGLHAARVVKNGKDRSVLNHASHFAGLSVDMRYADGLGGFTDNFGGQTVNNKPGYHIQKMLDAAKKEQADKADPAPNLDHARNWIADNRALMDQLGTDPNVDSVFIGPDWLMLALMKGKFIGGTKISGVASWKAPKKVSPSTNDHKSHWHVNLFDVPPPDATCGTSGQRRVVGR